MVKEVEHVDRLVNPKDIDFVILNGLTPQYDAEVGMLESSSDWPTREWIDRAVINPYERLECKNSAAESRVMLSARGHHSNDQTPSDAPFALAQATLLCNAANSRSPAVGSSRNNIRGMDNMASTAEATTTAEMAAEGAATVEAETVKIATGAAKYLNRSASATAPATSNSQYGGFWGRVRTNLGAGLLVVISACSALAARGTPRERHEDVSTGWQTARLPKV